MIIPLRMVLGGFSRPPSIKAAQILLPPLFHIQPVIGARNTRGLRFFNVGRAWSLKENARLWPILAHYGPFCEFTHFFVCSYRRLNNVKVFQNWQISSVMRSGADDRHTTNHLCKKTRNKKWKNNSAAKTAQIKFLSIRYLVTIIVYLCSEYLSGTQKFIFIKIRCNRSAWFDPKPRAVAQLYWATVSITMVD